MVQNAYSDGLSDVFFVIDIEAICYHRLRDLSLVSFTSQMSTQKYSFHEGDYWHCILVFDVG